MNQQSELLAELATLQRLCPEMRFGQLIANLAVVARGTEPGAIWHLEDDELLKGAKWQAAELRSRGRVDVA